MAIVSQDQLVQSYAFPQIESNEPFVVLYDIPSSELFEGINISTDQIPISPTNSELTYLNALDVNEDPVIVEEEEIWGIKKIVKKFSGQRPVQRKRAINILSMNRPRNEKLEIWNRDNLAFDQPIYVTGLFADGGAKSEWDAFTDGLKEAGDKMKDMAMNVVDNIIGDFFDSADNAKRLRNLFTKQPPENEPLEKFLAKYQNGQKVSLSDVEHLYKVNGYYYQPVKLNDDDEFVYWPVWPGIEDSMLMYINDFNTEIYDAASGNPDTPFHNKKPVGHKWKPYDNGRGDQSLNPIVGKGTSFSDSVFPHPLDHSTRQAASMGFDGDVPTGSPWALMQAIGPDFMKHKFDAFFMWNYIDNDPKSFEELLSSADTESDWITAYEKYILSRRGFAVRIGQITVPNIINDDYSIPFLETEIRKPKSTKTINNQTSFTLRLDQNLIWLDKINELAGHKNGIDETFPTHEDYHPYMKAVQANNTSLEWRHVLKTVAKSWPTHSKGMNYNVKDSEFCLVIKMVHLSNWINPNYQQRALPYFIFENVRILGLSDKLTYEREGESTQEITVNFIFKRCHQLTQELSGPPNYEPYEVSEFELTTNTVRKGNRDFSMFDSPRGRQWGIPQIPAIAELFDWKRRS